MSAATTAYIADLEERDLSVELKCVNALQQTPWHVNAFVLEVLSNVWESGHSWADLPPRDNLPLPKYPFKCEPAFLAPEQRDEFLRFKSERNKIHTFNNKSMSRRIQVERTIQIAEEYATADNMWYVWQLDFRGRKYPVESFLSPQNADYSKALLEFSTPATITTSQDAQWLAIHGANVFGVDKVSLEDREMWAYMNADNAIAVYEDPLENKWWLEADKPWQALAWCKEWAEYSVARANGEPYETRLPCASDGTCNGLQHLSAILRDYEGGRSVNLTPSDKPQDIYSDVAVRTTELLQQDGSELAHQLLSVGICRKICKRPVMIVPYSGTLQACSQYITESLTDKCTGDNPWDDDFFTPARLLSKYVWQAISEVIESAGTVMSYIQSIAKLYAQNNKPFQWVTPTNLLVVQDYPERKGRQIKTHISGSTHKLNWKESQEGTIDVRKTVSGSSPNVTHSLDAAALTLTVNTCVDLGMKDFAMVHDSYGTHSPNMPALNSVLREEFVKMYQDFDILFNLYQGAIVDLPQDCLIPAPPEKGRLKLEEVLLSDYFFS